jgi:hypothetical protein
LVTHQRVKTAAAGATSKDVALTDGYEFVRKACRKAGYQFPPAAQVRQRLLMARDSGTDISRDRMAYWYAKVGARIFCFTAYQRVMADYWSDDNGPQDHADRLV